MEKKGFIEEFALFSSLSVSMIGSGIFYAPAIISKYVGQNGWAVSIITGIIVFLIFLAINKLIELNHNGDITEILANVYGSVIGKILAFLFSLFMIIVLALFLRGFSEVITMYLLTNTPTEVIITTLVFIGMYLSRGGLANVVHFNEIVFWIMFVPIAIILLLTLPEADFSNLLPIGGYDVISYLKGSFEMLFLFSGFCVAFVLLPYVREKNKIKSVVGKSCIFVSIFYVVIFTIVCATLSNAQVSDSIFPTITMLQSITSRSGILEKWDSLVMSLWVIFYFTSFANIYYFASIIIKDIFCIKDVRTASAIYIPIVYVIAMFPENIIEVRNLKYNYLRIGLMSIIVIIIGLTLIISYFKTRRGATYEK